MSTKTVYNFDMSHKPNEPVILNRELMHRHFAGIISPCEFEQSSYITQDLYHSYWADKVATCFKHDEMCRTIGESKKKYRDYEAEFNRRYTDN